MKSTNYNLSNEAKDALPIEDTNYIFDQNTSLSSEALKGLLQEHEISLPYHAPPKQFIVKRAHGKKVEKIFRKFKVS